MDSAGGYADNAFLAEFYDSIESHRTRQDVSFFVEAAQNCGSRVLEIGCGTGRVLIPTARAGVEIAGLDASSLMLSVCRRKLQSEPEAVQRRVVALVEGDMRAFDFGQEFKLVTIPFRPFQHLLSVADQISCLRSIRRHLVADGRLILDIFNPSLPFLAERNSDEHGDEPEFTLDDGRQVRRRARIISRNYSEQITDNELIYYVTHRDGREERLVHRFPMRYLFRYEVEHLLVRCGFVVEEVYADYDKSLYGSKYPGELLTLARKA